MKGTSRGGLVVGCLSDTHGHLDPRAVAFFDGRVDHIVHAGDVGSPRVIIDLESIAPLTVVRGNTDPPSLGIALPVRATLELGGVCVCVAHEPPEVEAWELPSDAAVVITGHTHRPVVTRREGRLYVNPGSVFRPRGPEGRTVALLRFDGGHVDAAIVALDSLTHE